MWGDNTPLNENPCEEILLRDSYFTPSTSVEYALKKSKERMDSRTLKKELERRMKLMEKIVDV